MTVLRLRRAEYMTPPYTNAQSPCVDGALMAWGVVLSVFVS